MFIVLSKKGMGATDSIPMVSQMKSAVQYAWGDKEGARETQANFLNTFPVVSQGKSAYEWWYGDSEAARETQFKFLQGASSFADGIPAVGHAKGAVHYALGDKESGDCSMKAASRTTGVIGGGVIGGLTLGPAGAVAGGIAGGAAVDGMTTGIESAIENEYRPSGQVAAVGKIVKGEASVGEVFDSGAGFMFDGVAGYGAGQTAARIRANRANTQLYRVARESEVQNSVKTGQVKGPHSEVWLTESEAKAQQFYKSRPFPDKSTMEVQVPKKVLAELKNNAIDQHGYKAAVKGTPKASRPNMLNTEGISQPGTYNLGIKGKANLAKFNENIVGVQRYTPGRSGMQSSGPVGTSASAAVHGKQENDHSEQHLRSVLEEQSAS